MKTKIKKLMVCLGVEFFKLKLISYFDCEFREKKCIWVMNKINFFLKLCLDVEFFLDWKLMFFNGIKWLEMIEGMKNYV
jgi:hypothetical protein